MKLSWPAKIGIAAALVASLLSLFNAAWEPVFPIACAIIYLMGARSLWRGKAWGGYGTAIFTGIILTAVMLRAPVGVRELLLILVVPAVFCGILIWAGRFSPRSGGKRNWLLLAGATALFFAVLQQMVVPTGAMEGTILSGDQILVNRLARTPERGAIVVHRYPVDPRQTFVKRIVGVPGDRIHFENKKLFLNGADVVEPYVAHTTEYVDSYRDNFPRGEVNIRMFAAGEKMLRENVMDGELVVPPGKYFVLGDNRDNSLDSRYWGLIDSSDILGKPLMVYYSAAWHDATNEARRPTVLEARWGRMFKLL